MKIKVTRDGIDTLYDIDLSPRAFTLKELVRLEDLLGDVDVQALMTGELGFGPKLIQGMIFVKLVTAAPDISIDDFDVDLGELEDWAEQLNDEAVAAEGPLDIPMEVDGETVDAVVQVGDQGKG